MYLLAPWRYQFYVLAGLGSGALVLVSVAAVKGNSANHALLLFIDTMAALLVGSIPMGRDVRQFRRTVAETGKLPPFEVKHLQQDGNL